MSNGCLYGSLATTSIFTFSQCRSQIISRALPPASIYCWESEVTINSLLHVLLLDSLKIENYYLKQVIRFGTVSVYIYNSRKEALELGVEKHCVAPSVVAFLL